MILLLGYNLLCSYVLGNRLINNPRMNFQIWAIDNIFAGAVVKKTSNVPNISLFTELDIDEFQMTNLKINSLSRKLTTTDNKHYRKMIEDEIEYLEKVSTSFTSDLSKFRQPDFIAVDSSGYPSTKEDKIEDNAETKFFRDLLSGKHPEYQIVFDQYSGPDLLPWWVYPHYIDFVDSRLTVFRHQ